jgi:hypothetical protein
MLSSARTTINPSEVVPKWGFQAMREWIMLPERRERQAQLHGREDRRRDLDSPFEWLKTAGEAALGFFLCILGSSVFWHSLIADVTTIGSAITAIGGGFLTLHALWRWYKVYSVRRVPTSGRDQTDQQQSD